MTFFSTLFWGVFIAFILLYFIFRRISRPLMLAYVLLFSLAVAYNLNGPLAALLPATGVISWLLVLWMKSRKGWGRPVLLTLNILLTLAPLVLLKYLDAFDGLFRTLLESNFSFVDYFMPVGISFYTFQAISYEVDVYRDKFEGAGLLEYMFYLTFFPLLMCGPITRAGVLIPQTRTREKVSGEMLSLGLFLIMSGVLKKVVFADTLAIYNNWIFDTPDAYSGFEVVMGLLGYTMQIYLDFSGYSDMAIGMASVMGIALPDNFKHPYQSLNPTEFWRRWHISLSTWFRDYIYIPLGGNRHGKFRTFLNCFLTMVVAGVWHGSTLMFVIWGGLHGLALVIHKLFKPLLDRIPENWATKILCWLLMAVFVIVTWTVFRSPDPATLQNIWTVVTTDFSMDYLLPFINARTGWCIIFMIAVGMSFFKASSLDSLKKQFVSLAWPLKALVLLAVVFLAIHMSHGSVQPMIYAQF